MTVNKQTTKVTHDGVELTWNRQEEGPLSSEDAAKFYVDSVKALQKFREEDPRTQPELRKEKKLKQQADKARGDMSRGFVWGLIFAVFLFFFYRDCTDPSLDSPRRYYHH